MGCKRFLLILLVTSPCWRSKFIFQIRSPDFVVLVELGHIEAKVVPVCQTKYRVILGGNYLAKVLSI